LWATSARRADVEIRMRPKYRVAVRGVHGRVRHSLEDDVVARRRDREGIHPSSLWSARSTTSRSNPSAPRLMSMGTPVGSCRWSKARAWAAKSSSSPTRGTIAHAAPEVRKFASRFSSGSAITSTSPRLRHHVRLLQKLVPGLCAAGLVVGPDRIWSFTCRGWRDSPKPRVSVDEIAPRPIQQTNMEPRCYSRSRASTFTLQRSAPPYMALIANPGTARTV
jgi:hypothetical protein